MPKPQPGAPWVPAKYQPADVGAIQALMRGDASPEQQGRALRWIIEEAAKTYDISYHSEKPYDTSFAEGKRFVGTQIIKLTKLNVTALRKQDGRPREQPD